MNLIISKTKRIVFSASLVLTAAVWSSAMAAETMVSTRYTKDCKPLGISREAFKALPKRRARANSELFVKRLTRAQEYMGDEKYAESMELLVPMMEKYKDKTYALAQVYQFTSFVYAAQSNFKKSVEYTIKSIDLKVLPYGAEQTLLLRASSLYGAIEDYDNMEKYAKQWFKHAVNPNAQAYQQLGAAYVSKNKLKKAICPIFLSLQKWYPEEARKAASNLKKIQAAKDKGEPVPKLRAAKRPKKSLFRTLFSIHYQLKDIPGTISILKAGLHHYPAEKTFWTYLGNSYVQIEDWQNATAALSLGMRQNLLESGSDYRSLASDYTYVNVPYKAAEIMEIGLKKGAIEATKSNWRATASNWRRAQEFAKAANAFKRTAEVDDSGEFYISQGDVYLRMEKYDEAVSAYKQALKKGKLKKDDQGRTHLNMGITLTNSGKYRSAISAFKKAIKFKKQKRTASQWLNFTRNKLNTKG